MALLLCTCVALGSALADEGDPPTRAARLSDAEGAVALQPAGLQEWTAAELNRPLTSGDRLWVERGSRAELDMGGAAARLGGATGFAFINLDDATAQMQLTAGTLIVRVRELLPNQIYEIDTPNVAVSLRQPGAYRVEVNDAGDATVVKVSDGAAEVSGGARTIALESQQQLAVSGTSILAYDSETLGAPDDLDAWSASRERQFEDASSSEYVADDTPGVADLDNNGRWQDTPDYGYVWVPTVIPAGWVPYRFGNWAWIAPWGWTWVDAARWGYAPFHYGRWAQWRDGWCWVPGPQRGHALFAPALVAWVGGPSVGTSAAFGSSVGWFPLAPGEAYLPAYRVSPAYLHQINVTNTTIVNSLYLNQLYQSRVTPEHYANNRAAAVTTVPQSLFVSGERIGARALSLPPAVLAGALVTATAPAIAPTRQSVLGSPAGRSVARAPPALARRVVVARTAPPRAPLPFERQLSAIEANDGRPLAVNELARLQPASALVPVRLITQSGPVTQAAALPQHGATAPTLAEREHALENTSLPPAPKPAASAAAARTPASAAAPVATGTSPAPTASAPARSDRPPWAQDPSAPQRAPGSDDPTHASARAPSLPVYRPPGGPDPGLPDSSAAADSRGGARAAAHTAAGAPPATPAAPQSAPAKPSAREPRDSAPHGDRDSRERVER